MKGIHTISVSAMESGLRVDFRDYCDVKDIAELIAIDFLAFSTLGSLFHSLRIHFLQRD